MYPLTFQPAAVCRLPVALSGLVNPWLIPCVRLGDLIDRSADIVTPSSMTGNQDRRNRNRGRLG
jgi:hypothetical protein